MHFPEHLFLWRWHVGCSPWTLPAQLPGVTWAPALLQSKRKRKRWCSQFSVGNVGSCVPQPLWIPGIFSVACHAHPPPSTSWGLAPAAKLHKEFVSVLAPLWKPPGLPCQDQLSCMHWSTTLEICPREGKYRNHSRNLIWFLIFIEILQLKRKKQNPSPTGAFFLLSFFRLEGRTPFQQGLYTAAGNRDYIQKNINWLCQKIRLFI